MMNKCKPKSEEISSKILDIITRKDEYKRLRQAEVFRAINKIMIDYFERKGEFFFDDSASYYLEKSSGELLTLNPTRQTESFLSRFGMSPLDKEYQHALKALDLYAMNNGKKITLHSFAHYSKECNRVYLFNQDKHVYRISSDGIDRVLNGTDGVVFRKRQGSQPFELRCVKKPPVSILDNLILEPLEFAESALSSEEYKLICKLWILSMFLPELFPTKPILTVIGDHGCGKSTFIRSIGLILFGQSFQVTQLPNDSRSFDILLANSSYLALDNADSRIKWFEDRLAIAATGGSVKIRRLYSNSELCELPVSSFVAISSRTPHFRRPDIADRCIVIPLNPIEDDQNDAEYISEFEIQKNILGNRDKILIELAFSIKEILPALENQKPNRKTTFRMADFGVFALKLAEHSGNSKNMESILRKLNVKQDEFSAIDEPILEILEIWAEMSENGDREISSADLLP